jgi:excisionase family DNA binding protein
MDKMKSSLGELPDLLTLKQACEVLNCHANTLRKWDNNGFFKAIRFGARKDRRYRKEDIAKFLNKNT